MSSANTSELFEQILRVIKLVHAVQIAGKCDQTVLVVVKRHSVTGEQNIREFGSALTPAVERVHFGIGQFQRSNTEIVTWLDLNLQNFVDDAHYARFLQET